MATKASTLWAVTHKAYTDAIASGKSKDEANAIAQAAHVQHLQGVMSFSLPEKAARHGKGMKTARAASKPSPTSIGGDEPRDDHGKWTNK